jgi:hypothetical protein
VATVCSKVILLDGRVDGIIHRLWSSLILRPFCAAGKCQQVYMLVCFISIFLCHTRPVIFEKWLKALTAFSILFNLSPAQRKIFVLAYTPYLRFHVTCIVCFVVFLQIAGVGLLSWVRERLAFIIIEALVDTQSIQTSREYSEKCLDHR